MLYERGLSTLQKVDEDGASSDSDYGDWGSDDWGFNEPKKASKKVSVSLKVGSGTKIVIFPMYMG